MLKTLIKKQILEIFQMYFINRKTGKARSPLKTVVFFSLFALLLLGVGISFYFMASGLGYVILGHGINWIYFALMSLIAMALGVFGSVFNTYATVYLPKDNELLISLPIPGRTLLLSRLSGVFVTSLMYSAWVWIPVIIAYWIKMPVNVRNIIFPLLLMVLIALFVSALSTILGFVVAVIAIKAKGKSFVRLFLSLGILGLYYFVYFKIVASIGEILSDLDGIGDTVKTWLYYTYLLGKAADGEVIPMILVTVITFAFAGTCFLVLSKTFMKLSIADSGVTKSVKAPADYTKRSVKSALFRREIKHFTSLTTWMLNGGLGVILMPVASVVILIKYKTIHEVLPEILAEIPVLSSFLPILILALVCLIISTNAILPVAISIEGKALWQIQSLPIGPWDVLGAKIKMAVHLNLYPTLFFVLACGIVTGINWWEISLICVASILFILCISNLGLFLDLKMTNLNWMNVSSLTKQSVPVLINVFGGWGFSILLGVGGFFLIKIVESWIVILGFMALFAGVWLVMHRWIRIRGTVIFARLQ